MSQCVRATERALRKAARKATGHKLPHAIYLEIASFVELPGGDTDDEDGEGNFYDSTEDLSMTSSMSEGDLSSSEDECEF